MPDRRQQRRQRVRQEAGGDRSVGASNREPVKQEPLQSNNSKSQKQGATGIAYAEAKEYESVTIMPDKETAEPQKYKRREILNNWLRYEDLPPEEPDDGEDYMVGEDFTTILEQQVNVGGHMMLKGETLWDDTESNILRSHGLGALHVADLVAAINTIPLQVQLNIPETVLPDSVIEFYSNLADDNRKVYQPNTSFSDSLDVNEKLLQSLKLSDDDSVNLASESVKNESQLKNAVDVALTLTEAFAPEPDDADLDLLVREPGLEELVENKQEGTTQLKEESIEKEPKPVKELSPVRDQTPLRDPSIEKPTILPLQNEFKTDTCLVSSVKDEIDQLSKQRESVKEKSPTFNFGLPKTDVTNTSMNFSLPKQDLSSDNQANAIIANALKDVDLGMPSKEEEKIPKGPSVDLDAPIEQTKPVLLISKTEEEDLEDWLDSVLDD
ncbi:hypothetical protein SK128_004686 [Halocaridina rubra]|uniref:Cell death regulator Aven n=1 Tax=Halocaridina rubra TaxID=373956 RepID=A0AAN9A777_HALRR